MHRAATAGYDGEAVDGGKSKAKFYTISVGQGTMQL